MCASTCRSPRYGSPTRSLSGSCRRTSGSSSPTCSAPGTPCAPLPGNSPGTQPRLAGRYAVTATRAPASTTPFQAQRRASVRRARSKEGKIRRDPELKEFIQQRLDRRWSPEQICQALRTAFPDEPDRHLAHETIYQAVYLPHRGGLERAAGALRAGRPARRRRRHAAQRATRFIDPGTLISHRPPEVDDRAVAGHWEGDLIVGTANRSAIGTLVDRTTRYVKLLHLPDSHSAENVRDALLHAFTDLPAELAHSLTWDQGSEMSRHDEFTRATGIPVYFCEPASPWQRGSNENTNGLLRQYFPKSTDLSIFSAEDLAFVAAELNSRPRRTLGWQTPADLFAKLVATLE